MSTEVKKLKFGRANAKLQQLEKKTGKKVYTFSVSSGFSCLGAQACLSKVVETYNKGKKTRKVVDGPKNEFRCYSASLEALFKNVYENNKNNRNQLNLCKTAPEVTSLILSSLPKDAEIVRISAAGDIESLKILQGWIGVAKANPKVLFYAYTKAVPLFLRVKLPKNFIITYSLGGKYDALVLKKKLRYAKVVYSVAEARKLKLPIDHDDSHAIKPKGNFSLLIHGKMPAGSEAGKAVKRLNGLGSYTRKK